jgi:predicted dehydrogenase
MDPMLRFMPMEGEAQTPEYRAATGYLQELEYFTQCLAANKAPQRVTGFDGREAVRLILAEKESAETGKIVTL